MQPPRKSRKYKPYRTPSHDEGGDDEGIWLMSYADMVTLLMGFFVLLVSMSTFSPKKFDQVQKATQYFGGNYKDPYEALSKTLSTAIASSELEQVTLERKEDGLILDFQGALFFDSGSTRLKQDGLTALQKVIPYLKSQNRAMYITIEGHTDDLPVGKGLGQITSNWELSSLRACRVLQVFEEAGFSKFKMKALGWGDTKSKVPNTTEANRAINRRVVVKISTESSIENEVQRATASEPNG